MNILIIGGTGTLSKPVCELANNIGYNVTVLNRGNKNDFESSNISTIVADISKENALNDAVCNKQFDVVIDFIAFNKQDVERDYNVFKGKIKQYIFISSASAYSKPIVTPYINESYPLKNNIWEYSKNKIECEDFLLDKYRAENFPITIIRPSHTYGLDKLPVAIHGAKGSFSIVQRMLKLKPIIVHGDGTSFWTLTYNKDFAKGLCGLIGNSLAMGEAYNIVSDEALTWNHIIDTIAKSLNVEASIVHIASDTIAKYDPSYTGTLLGDKAHSLIFDTSKIKKAVKGFESTTNFDTGCRLALDYIFKHKQCQTLDPEFDSWCDGLLNFSGIN